MLTPVHTTVSPVGALPTRGSCGQLFVYETLSPGRFAAAAHALQKKNADMLRAELDDANEAFELLRGRSRSHNQKIAATARSVIEGQLDLR